VQAKLKSQPVASAPNSSSDDALIGAPATAGDRAIASEAAESYKKGNFDDAIQKLGYLARKNPYDANTQFALGQAFRGKNKTSEALKHLRSAATLDPKNDMYVKALNDVQSQADEQQTASAADAGAGGGGGSSAGSAGAGSGVQPFVGLPGSDSSQSALANSGDLAAVQNYLNRNAGNVMIGSATSYGTMGGSGFSPFGGGMMMGTSPGSTRLRRVVSSSLSGAAMGAMMNRGYPGGMSKGAMRGAMYGGLFGLMLGGF
jgi:hypothetical protein